MFNMYRFTLKHSGSEIINILYGKRLHSTKVHGVWKSVVGLEVHAQISSISKLFSGAKCDFEGLVNDCVSPFDASIPGTLPVLNKRCVEAGVLAALALSCKINAESSFDRKHYFYADLPAGYQITQQRSPIAQNGEIRFLVYAPGVHKKPYEKISKIKQIQLEQDSGKSLHDDELQISLVDLNRAGMPLIEFVFEPDLKDGEEAAALVKELILILERIGCCGGHMEKGEIRVDANISVNREGEKLGTRTEIKNISSIRGVAGAVKYEINRQIKLLENGGNVINETRSWNSNKRVTVSMRDKEMKQDYRYMPEPNLPPLRLNINEVTDSDLVNVMELHSQIPELPHQTRERLIKQFNLSGVQSMQIGNENVLLNYFFDLCGNNSKVGVKAALFLMNELLFSLNKHEIPLENCKVKSEYLKQLFEMKNSNIISLNTVKNVLDIIIFEDKCSPEEIVKSNNWLMINDPVEIERICLEAINGNPTLVKEYKKGKISALKTFHKIILKNTHDRINMRIAVVKLEEMLKNYN